MKFLVSCFLLLLVLLAFHLWLSFDVEGKKAIQFLFLFFEGAVLKSLLEVNERLLKQPGLLSLSV